MGERFEVVIPDTHFPRGGCEVENIAHAGEADLHVAGRAVQRPWLSRERPFYNSFCG